MHSALERPALPPQRPTSSSPGGHPRVHSLHAAIASSKNCARGQSVTCVTAPRASGA